MNTQRILRVQDIMRTEVRSIDRLATVAEAIVLMRRHGVSSLVVPRRDDDDEFGLILVSDIASKVIAENRAPERVNVYEVMSKPVLTLASRMQARYAVRLLVRFGVSPRGGRGPRPQPGRAGDDARPRGRPRGGVMRRFSEMSTVPTAPSSFPRTRE